MIRVESDKRYVDIRLNRPESRNALSIDLLAKLRDTLAAALLDGAPAVVISGDGGIFSAGADLGDLTGTSADVVVDNAIAAVVEAIREAEFPVIAWIDGACIGGAVDIVLACDFRIASPKAWFQVPATRLGLLYNPAAVARMHAMLPRDTLTRLLTHGERFNARQALAAGLVTHVSHCNENEGPAPAPPRAAADNVDSAVAATRKLLDALDNDEYDAEYWQKRRVELMNSPERAAAISAARGRNRG